MLIFWAAVSSAVGLTHLSSSLCSAPPSPEASKVEKYCHEIPLVLADCEKLIQDESVPRAKLCDFMKGHADLECARSQYTATEATIEQQLYTSCLAAIDTCQDMDCFLKAYDASRDEADANRKSAMHAKKAIETATSMKLVGVQREISDVYAKAELQHMMEKVNEVLSTTREQMAVRISKLPQTLEEVSNTVPAYMKQLQTFVQEDIEPGVEDLRKNAVSVVEQPTPVTPAWAPSSLVETAAEEETVDKEKQVRDAISALQMQEREKAELRQQVETELRQQLGEEDQIRTQALRGQRQKHLDSLADDDRYKGLPGAKLGSKGKRINNRGKRQGALVQSNARRETGHGQSAPEEIGNWANAGKNLVIAVVRHLGRGVFGANLFD